MRRVLVWAMAIAGVGLIAWSFAINLIQVSYEAGYRAGQIDYAAGVRRWIITERGSIHEIRSKR